MNTTVAPRLLSTPSKPLKVHTVWTGDPWSFHLSEGTSRASYLPSGTSTAACGRRAGLVWNQAECRAIMVWAIEHRGARIEWWKRMKRRRRKMEGTMCMYAEQEAEEGTLKWPSKDPCPWTSEMVGTVNPAAATFQPVPQFGGRTHRLNITEWMCLTCLLYNKNNYKEVILDFSYSARLLLSEVGKHRVCYRAMLQELKHCRLFSDTGSHYRVCDQCMCEDGW